MYDTINLIRLREFKRDLSRMCMIDACQKHVSNIRSEATRHYFGNPDYHQAIAAQLIYGLALDTDVIVTAIWKHLDLHLEKNISLIATGGYGRRELHPYSDIDLLIYYRGRSLSEEVHTRVQQFITALWDTNLKSSATIRSDKQLQKDSRSDIALATCLLESRLLVGDRESVIGIKRKLCESLWSTRKFFLTKRKEQQIRHLKYNNISYQLEPDIKNSPGGLRDVHTIMWVARHCLGINHSNQLVEEQLISPAGMRKLSQSRNFLWSMRLGVHLLSGRAEERFLIDYQRELAERLGFTNSREQRAVEALMQQHYNAVLAITAVNDSVMQKFEEHISRRVHLTKRRLHDDFFVMAGTLYCYDERCFERDPSNLLRCFLLLGKNSRVEKLSAQCIHAIYENSFLIDDAFRQNPVNKKLFIRILSLPSQQSEILELMKRYGILGNYLPDMGRVTGQIQHDLFHMYTVDAHTLLLIQNLQAMLIQEQDKDMEIPAQIARQLPQFLTIIVAGLFHDIAKGRGGDHSILGEAVVIDFAVTHGFSQKEIELLAWLVRHHLLMSATAQSKDLSDPRVIDEFAGFVENKIRLDYLYVLTVADIKATNISLWNSWRAALLTRLYLDARERLSQQSSPTIDAIIRDRKELALRRIPAKDQDRTESLWQLLDKDFFVNKSPENLAWQTAQVLKFRAKIDRNNTLVMIRATHQLMSHGATEIAVYLPVRPMIFADIVYILDSIDLDTQEARIHNTSDGYVFDSFIVLDRDNKPLAKNRYPQVRDALESVFDTQYHRTETGKIKRYIPSRLHKFWFDPVILVRRDESLFHIDITCLDCPGLLMSIAESCRHLSLEIINARINTIGAKAKDSFIAQANAQISETAIEKQLCKAITDLMDMDTTVISA